MAKAGIALAALLCASTAVRQAEAVPVASSDDFVAAVLSGAESIEVTEHLFLNSAYEQLERPEDESEFGFDPSQGYLLNVNGTGLTIMVRVRTLAKLRACVALLQISELGLMRD